MTARHRTGQLAGRSVTTIMSRHYGFATRPAVQRTPAHRYEGSRKQAHDRLVAALDAAHQDDVDTVRLPRFIATASATL